MCLASVKQDYVPDTQERGTLQLAGLGEKRVTVFVNSDSYDLYMELTSVYPKLTEGGGYDLLRVQEGGGKQLVVIACPEN